MEQPSYGFLLWVEKIELWLKATLRTIQFKNHVAFAL